MAEIDTLQVKITANAKSATDSLRSLKSALEKVRTALTGMKDGVSISDHLSKSLNEMNGALSTISTGGIKRLQKLANALNDYADAIKRVKGAKGGASISATIKDTEKALSLPSSETSKSGVWTLKDSMDVSVEAGSSGYLDPYYKLRQEILQTETVMQRAEGTFRKFFGSLFRRHDSANDVKVGIAPLTGQVRKLGEETEKAGKKAQKASGTFGKLVKSIGRIMFYRAIRSALKAIGEAFNEGLKNAYGYSQQSETFTRLADTLDRIKSITDQMINQLGALWGELKQLILPVIETIVEKVRQAAEVLTEFFAALNGENTYLRARYEEKKWDDATESVKKYKHQLLGLDELNNITTQQGNGKVGTDYSTLYEEVPVSDKMLKLGQSIRDTWDAVTKKIQESLAEIETILGTFMIGVGAALLFSGANIPLGLGLIIAGGFMASKAIKEKWDELGDNIQARLGLIEIALGGFTFGLGAVMAFSGANIPLGIGLMIAGATALAAGLANLKWDELENDIKERIVIISGIVGGALLVVGSILTFSGANLPLGIGLMAAGALALGTSIALGWSMLEEELKFHIGVISGIVGGALLVLGAILAFSGVALPLGLGLMAAGAVGLGTSIALNWDAILDGLKGAWENIKNWWNNTVIAAVKRGVERVEDILGIDFNKDGIIGGISTTHISDAGVTSGGTHGKFATGGIPTQGTLFYAGESGAEFVGNIGTTSAVANTGQMTDAIFKAAYMGMSKALKENGGANGMAGFVPATTDDLFIAMRKKASTYNKTTGNPAFA